MALYYLDECIAHAPHAKLYLKRALLYQHDKQYEKALQDCLECIKEDVRMIIFSHYDSAYDCTCVYNPSCMHGKD